MIQLYRGFSLLELLIAMALVAILACLAYPNYQHQLTRVHRKQAEIALTKAAEEMENYYALNNTYEGANLSTLKLPAAHNDYYYYYALQNLSDDTYRIQATSKKTDEACGILWIDETGDHGAMHQDCWNT